MKKQIDAATLKKFIDELIEHLHGKRDVSATGVRFGLNLVRSEIICMQKEKP